MGYTTLQNQTCAIGETDSGPIWSLQEPAVLMLMHRRCPGNPTNSSDDSYKALCCPTEGSCGDALLGKARCVDHTADIYIVLEEKQYFCCSKDNYGFTVPFRGCTDLNGLNDPAMDEFLSPIAQYHLSASMSSNTTTGTTASSTSAAVTNNANTNTSRSNTGAIPGGVVGGVASVTILITPACTRVTELGGQGISELPESEKQRPPPTELPRRLLHTLKWHMRGRRGGLPRDVRLVLPILSRKYEMRYNRKRPRDMLPKYRTLHYIVK
ncbi:hypothetical protein N7463_010458 [Penicillium fimorum]|uniref:Uncharacterized protein n=1 Tax=Penicillium fimorum TaxID=1882269 RepID=A0A9W9XJY5_9EURO|nr:hypothetical protein N7463_010458 [Penicillium fimorum]